MIWGFHKAQIVPRIDMVSCLINFCKLYGFGLSIYILVFGCYSHVWTFFLEHKQKTGGLIFKTNQYTHALVCISCKLDKIFRLYPDDNRAIPAAYEFLTKFDRAKCTTN